MKHCTDVLLYACHFADCFSKVADESGILICDDVLGNSKPGEEMFKVEVRYAMSIYDLITGQKLCHFRAFLIYYS